MLLYDRYDIWRVSPDGTGAKNITAGYGRAHDLRLRYIRTEAENPRERWIDGTKPVMLQGENLKTFETGFFRASLDGGEPKQLVLSPKYMSPPVKAKDADVYLLTAQTFSEFPDLVTTDGSFKELRKVSDANPQKANLLWGTSEVVQFKNADGVPLTGALYKPENFDPTKKYPMMVYIYERLDAEREPLRGPASQPQYQSQLLHQQRVSGVHAGHRLHHRLPGAERAEVRAARRCRRWWTRAS